MRENWRVNERFVVLDPTIGDRTTRDLMNK
jgi:hypothetical protein